MSDIATKLTTIAENQQKVYDAGYAAGQSAGGNTEEAYQQGVVDGKQAEYESFWNAYLPNDLYSLVYLFAGYCWNDNTFKPPNGTIFSVVNCVSKSVAGMFQNSRITDLVSICNKRGLTFNFSGVTNFAYMICDSFVRTFPAINASSAQNLNTMLFNGQSLVSVGTVTLKDDGSQTFTNFANSCKNLVDITFEGVIGQSINFQWSPSLSKDSITSIINALSTTTSGLSVTFSKTAVNKVFETSEGAADGEKSDAWTTLRNTKTNWTVSLA